ncbi:MAG: BON domain-containing protein [Planctomycetes bacterium]|nr:BON domain-containing protein [Planctomycetota bacterium]MCG2682330.1 BON domain-containing protein [Planctomycetales bacterium]
MRLLLTGFVVAAITAVVPALALAGNQEVAEDIANRLRGSGQMSDYKIGVKYQDGTAWLRGRVTSQGQMETALRLVFRTPEVDRVVNQLTISSPEARRFGEAAPTGYNPLRDKQPRQLSLVKRLETAVNRGYGQGQPQPRPIREDDPAYANRLPSSYTPSGVEPTAAEEPQGLPRQTAAPRPMARVAMMQPEMRGPVSPNGQPRPMYAAAASRAGVAPARYDQPCMPNYAWPSYASYPNYAALTYPKQYSPTAWPYIGPFYPYPQVPMGWRKVTLEWDDGWWFLDFSDQPASCWHR